MRFQTGGGSEAFHTAGKPEKNGGSHMKQQIFLCGFCRGNEEDSDE